MVQLRKASIRDIPTMVELSHAKRLDYEKAQPQFWRHADEAEKIQLKWFEELLARDDHLLFVASRHDQITGFIIRRLLKAPEVYNPGGLTLMIDDFCLREEDKWVSTGAALLKELQNTAKKKGAEQTLVVCGAHDENKRYFLKSVGLQVASEWYVGGIKG